MTCIYNTPNWPPAGGGGSRTRCARTPPPPIKFCFWALFYEQKRSWGPWGLSSASWGPCGLYWEVLGGLLGRLGCLLRASWGLLGGLAWLLGASWRPLATTWGPTSEFSKTFWEKRACTWGRETSFWKKRACTWGRETPFLKKRACALCRETPEGGVEGRKGEAQQLTGPGRSR